ncbi:MAG TPA: hypothetical protein DCE56_02595 [Cyanobacteria bacterium UBA8553]|nr:hypothetical protein [Cyanobacteria bacterium UBA8553]
MDYLADTWTPLIVQYKTAGDLLLSSNNSEAVAMPAIFLYRQCVELLLKRHILVSLEILQFPFEEFAKGYQKKHSLDYLFCSCQQLIDRLDRCDRAPENVADAIAYFQNLDPDSVSLRYPLRSDGSLFQVTLTEEMLNSVRSHLEQIATFFYEQYLVLITGHCE